MENNNNNNNNRHQRPFLGAVKSSGPTSEPGTLTIQLGNDNPAWQAHMRARDKGFSQASAQITDKKPNHAGKPSHTQPCFQFLAWGPPSPSCFHTSASSRTSLGANFQRETGSASLPWGCCGDLGMNCGTQSAKQLQVKHQLQSRALSYVPREVTNDYGNSLPSSPRVKISTLSPHEGFCSAVPLPWAVVLDSAVTTAQRGMPGMGLRWGLSVRISRCS